MKITIKELKEVIKEVVRANPYFSNPTRMSNMKAGEKIFRDQETTSIRDMQRTAFQIMVDNGMDEKTAEDTVMSMPTRDLERYVNSRG